MPSSGMRRVDPVKLTDVSVDRIASIFRVEKSAKVHFTGSTRRHIPEDGILLNINHSPAIIMHILLFFWFLSILSTANKP
jgi:hypothetical protein